MTIYINKIYYITKYLFIFRLHVLYLFIAVVRNLFPGHPGFRVVSAPEHKVSQQPPLSIAPILTTSLECQQYRGLIPAASLMGGVPIFLFLFARVSIHFFNSCKYICCYFF